MNPREAEAKAKKKPGAQQHQIRRRRPIPIIPSATRATRRAVAAAS